MKEDIYKLVKWLELREYRLRAGEEKSEDEKEIHYHFKKEYGIRLFETNAKEVLDLIFNKK